MLPKIFESWGRGGGAVVLQRGPAIAPPPRVHSPDRILCKERKMTAEAGAWRESKRSCVCDLEIMAAAAGAWISTDRRPEDLRM